MSSPYITIRGLSYSFTAPLQLGARPPKTTALNNINLVLDKEKRVALLGENGAGKTTLLRILATSIIPSRGQVTIGQFTVGKDDTAIKSLTGFAPNDDRSFYWRLTGRQNLAFFAALYGLSPRDIPSKIGSLLSEFRVGYADRRFDTYSTGMKRKFALMRAMLHGPDLLLLDEPTKSLDHSSSQRLRTHIEDRTTQNQTVLIATHDLDEAEHLCDYFIMLHRGHVRDHGSLEDLRRRSKPGASSLKSIYLELTGHDQ